MDRLEWNSKFPVLGPYFAAIVAIAAAVLLRLAIEPLLGDRSPFVTLIIAVIIVARYFGGGPAWLTLTAGSAAVAFFILEPRYSFDIVLLEFRLALVLTIIIGFAIIITFGSLENARRRLDEHRQQLRREVTDRRTAEKLLAEQTDRLRITLASIGDAVITTDRTGCITYMNAMAETLTGWVSEEAAGKPLSGVFRVVDESTHQTIANPATKALKEAAVVGMMGRKILVAKDGTERPIEDNAAPIRCNMRKIVVGSVLVFRDVSDRRRQERELESRERQFRNLADSIPHLCWMANPAGEIFWFNRSWFDYTGTNLGTMVGRGWHSVHTSDELPVVLERWKVALASGEAFDMSYSLRSKDGKYRRFVTHVVPVKDENGRVLRWFGTNTDIAAVKEAEQQAVEAEVDLREPVAAMR